MVSQRFRGEHIVAALYISLSRIRFQAMTLLFVVGLKYCLAQMIVITRRHVAHNIPVATFKQIYFRAITLFFIMDAYQGHILESA